MKLLRITLLCTAVAILAAAVRVSAAEQIDTNALGISVGGAAADRIGFHGTTPVAQRSGAAQTALTDNTTGTATTTLAAGVGVTTISIPVNLASITTDADIVTAVTLGYKFKVLASTFVVTAPATTSGKATTVSLKIGSTAVTGGAAALTSANCTPLGATVSASAITAANTGSASATLSVVSSSTTAFAEGSGVLLLKVQNMDTADAVAGIVVLENELRAALAAKGLIKGGT